MRGGIAGPVAALAAFVAAPFALEAAGSGYWVAILTRGLIFATAAMALQFVLGRGGLVCFGFAAFMGIGAYAVGIPYAHGIEEGLLVLPLAMLAAGSFAALTGAIAMRTEGVYFIMITLAFGQMAFHFGGALSDYGGDDGLTLWSRPSLGGLPLLDGRRPLYFWALGAAALTFLGLRALGASAFGRLIDGARQNPARMRALGVDVARWRLRAYALAGALGGLAGALLAIHAEFVSPAYMHWTRSGELIVMVVLGGVASLGGAGLAAVGLIAAEEALSGLSEHWRILLGLIVLGVALFAPRGVGGLLRGRR